MASFVLQLPTTGRWRSFSASASASSNGESAVVALSSPSASADIRLQDPCGRVFLKLSARIEFAKGVIFFFWVCRDFEGAPPGWSHQNRGQGGGGGPVIVELPLDKIRRPLMRTRANDPVKVRDLMDSIREIGLQVPVSSDPHPSVSILLRCFVLWENPCSMKNFIDPMCVRVRVLWMESNWRVGAPPSALVYVILLD